MMTLRYGNSWLEFKKVCVKEAFSPHLSKPENDDYKFQSAIVSSVLSIFVGLFQLICMFYFVTKRLLKHAFKT